MMLEIILLNREYLAKPVGVLNFNGFRFFVFWGGSFCLLGEGVCLSTPGNSQALACFYSYPKFFYFKGALIYFRCRKFIKFR